MLTTRATLLMRVRDPADERAWREFHRLYASLLYHYARGRGLSHDDAEEIRDECFTVLTRTIPKFQYDRSRGRFKGWLQCVVDSKIADLRRKRRPQRADTQQIADVPDPQPSPAEIWEQNWRREHLQSCLEQVENQVSDHDYRAFRLLIEACQVLEICRRLGVNANQVYKAKSRILRLVAEAFAEYESIDVPGEQ